MIKINDEEDQPNIHKEYNSKKFTYSLRILNIPDGMLQLNIITAQLNIDT